MLTLKVSERNVAGKKDLLKLRKEGFLPAVIYGRKEHATPIKLPSHDFKKIFKHAGESTIISLTGLGEEKEVLVHDVDYDPILNEPRHIDFYVIEKGKKIRVNIPLEFVGVAPAIKELGGILVKVVHELEIEVLPKDLPHNIEVDLSSLVDLDAQIHVKDLTLPEGVIAISDAEEVVAAVSEAVEEEIAPPEAPDLASIQVEKKGKEDVTEEEGGGGQ
jgi:large subunit ribosomal protein L25